MIERSTMSGHSQRAGGGGSPTEEHMGITLRSCKLNGYVTVCPYRAFERQVTFFSRGDVGRAITAKV